MTYKIPLGSDTAHGILQAGSGITVVDGVISADGGSSSIINVKLVSSNYTATAQDYYIGATRKDITITFPLGIVGKVYVVKNQASSGNITVKGTGQDLDESGDKVLGSGGSMIAVFDGTRWNLV